MNTENIKLLADAVEAKGSKFDMNSWEDCIGGVATDLWPDTKSGSDVILVDGSPGPTFDENLLADKLGVTTEVLMWLVHPEATDEDIWPSHLAYEDVTAHDAAHMLRVYANEEFVDWSHLDE